MATNYVRATEGFLTSLGGGRSRGRTVKGGEVFASDDPIVKAHKALFEPVSEYVERATRGPGELRATRRSGPPSAKAKKSAWVGYATQRGIDVDGLTKDEIIAAVEAAEGDG